MRSEASDSTGLYSEQGSLLARRCSGQARAGGARPRGDEKLNWASTDAGSSKNGAIDASRVDDRPGAGTVFTRGAQSTQTSPSDNEGIPGVTVSVPSSE
jgi:hypothetical protein